MKSNIALNAFSALKNEYKSVGKEMAGSFYGEKPLTHSLRNAKSRAAFEKSGMSAADFKKAGGYGEGSFSWKRAGLLAGTAYAGTDMAYRGISGGSLYRNNSGERDFVGVPFL